MTPPEKEISVRLVITVLKAQQLQSLVLLELLRHVKVPTNARPVQLVTIVLVAQLSQSNATLDTAPLVRSSQQSARTARMPMQNSKNLQMQAAVLYVQMPSGALKE